MERDQSHNTTRHDSYIRINNIEYGKIGEYRLLLGLHLPHEIDQTPLVIGIHGGAWQPETKKLRRLSIRQISGVLVR